MLLCHLRKGQIARSIKGRDKGRYYIVLACEENIVLVTDGDRRPLSKPKRKNVAHLWYTKTIVNCDDDLAIKEALMLFD